MIAASSGEPACYCCAPRMASTNAAMPPDTDKRLLLEQLRIDPAHRDDHPGSARAWWIGALVVGVLVLIGGAVTWWVTRGPRFEVEVATASPPAAAAGPTTILQATGYVTARRQATVSAQITGALTQVLIEEGERGGGRSGVGQARRHRPASRTGPE